MQQLKFIKSLIDQGVSAYHIQQILKNDGIRVWCFGSYYSTVNICFYETDHGVKADKLQNRRRTQKSLNPTAQLNRWA